MPRIARISTPVEAAAQPYVVVPVVFDEGAAFVAQSIPTTLGGLTIERVLSAQWCQANGLKPGAGATSTLRTLNATSVVLVSLGSSISLSFASTIDRVVSNWMPICSADLR